VHRASLPPPGGGKRLLQRFNDRPISWTTVCPGLGEPLPHQLTRMTNQSSHTRSSLSKLPSIQRSRLHPPLPVAFPDEDMLHTCSLIVSPICIAAGQFELQVSGTPSAQILSQKQPSMQYAEIIRLKLNQHFNLASFAIQFSKTRLA